MQNVRPEGQGPNRVLISNLFLYSIMMSLNLDSGRKGEVRSEMLGISLLTKKEKNHEESGVRIRVYNPRF